LQLEGQGLVTDLNVSHQAHVTPLQAALILKGRHPARCVDSAHLLLLAVRRVLRLLLGIVVIVHVLVIVHVIEV
jgi:hypothetical protein